MLKLLYVTVNLLTAGFDYTRICHGVNFVVDNVQFLQGKSKLRKPTVAEARSQFSFQWPQSKKRGIQFFHSFFLFCTAYVSYNVDRIFWNSQRNCLLVQYAQFVTVTYCKIKEIIYNIINFYFKVFGNLPHCQEWLLKRVRMVERSNIYKSKLIYEGKPKSINKLTIFT